ncbi:Prolyl oligopeptidase family protein [Gracilibacillus orientalis]|uniref:Prolyl oligopeptidase family protein n=1 Tax=Gracilibacillus orientalis TaxID=334253 RepID=A0A1I4L6Y1_9BACI|nr:alpha/beta hydrolase [Gracilibacillus orientalis]SFL86742.1 Prolyl oligopeptidase family protein [Gracilibacillus orientalis]
MKIIEENYVNWEDQSLHQDVPSITPYLIPDKQVAPIILVIPGGGYGHRAYHEGEPVAKWLNQNGIHACVLRYQVAPISKQETIAQAQQAIQLIKKKKKDWSMNDQNKVGVLGFSAGGHLAAVVSNHYTESGGYSSRPDFQILCYPVITMGEFTHEGSKANLLGKNPNQQLIDQYSCEKIVHEDTPPTFIWSTANDQSVLSLNSLKYTEALQRCHIPYELHIYQDGRHGLGLAEEHPNTMDWKNACIRWLTAFITESEED